MSVVEIHGFEKRYGNAPVISSLDMRVDKGDIYDFLGRNGAGKSTLLKMLCGLATPTSGEISLFDGAKDAQERIGVLIESPGLFPNLNAFENMMTKAYALGLVDAETQCRSLLADVGLGDAKQKTRDFSRGMRQRLGIALTLLGSPDLLFLDEPLNGLDLEGAREISDLFKRLVQTTDLTIVITSHVPGHLNHMATRFGVIKDGMMVRG